MTLTVQQLAELLEGKIEGNSNLALRYPAKIEEAKEGAICFLANPKYEEHLYRTEASVVLVANNFTPKEKTQTTLLKVQDPYSSFVKVLHLFSNNIHDDSGIHPSAVVHKTATIGENVFLGANSVISEGAVIGTGTKVLANTTVGKYAKVGNNCLLYSNCSVYHFCELGNNVILHSGCVIGSDGFGFAPLEDGSYTKIPQVGNVVIGNDVEVGANSTIDRATMGSTIIHDGVKIDNLVQIAHNVVIDQHTVVAAQAGISGSTKLGKYVVVGGQAGFVGHIQVADKTRINAQSGISKTVKEEGQFLSGTPAFNYREELKSKLIFKRLPELEKRVSNLEQQNKKQ